MVKVKSVFWGIVLLIVLTACNQEPPVTPSPTASAGTAAATMTPGARSGVTVLAEGKLEAVNPVLTLAFDTNGRLLSVDVAPGDVVAAGDRVATLDDTTLREAVANAELQLAQAQSDVKQAQQALDELLNWAPDALVVAQAEANLAAAEADVAAAKTQDAAAGNSLTSARITFEQAERGLADAQDAYNTAYDPGREWEFGVEWMRQRLEDERKGATRSLALAEENLEVARAGYNLALAGFDNDKALSAEAALASAQQTLDQANKGPKPGEIGTAELNLEKAELNKQQNALNLQQAQSALERAFLLAPGAGTVVSVDAAEGALVSSGASIVTLLDMSSLEFHTTNLSERDLAQIAAGQTAVITLKAYPNDPINGEVLRIGVQATDEVGDAAVFPVVIRLAQTELDIRPGMTGRVEIQRIVNED